MTGNTTTWFTTFYRRSTHRILNDGVKRLIDVFISALGLILLSPLFAFIAIRIKHDSPGPVFFRGERAGKNGTFNILKFRTMQDTPESYQGPKVTAQDDPRITSFGRWLRDTKLNELPQLWNVFKGEMSLVGPRPEDPEIAAAWPASVRKEVLSVRPGITSPASVLYRNEEALLVSGNVMDTYLESILPTKLRLDQLYVRNRSLLLDFDIIFWTFLIWLPRLGEYAPLETSLFMGPVSIFTRRYVGWFVVDTLVTLFAMGLTGLFWRSFAPLNVGQLDSFMVALGFALLFSISGASFGVNKISWSKATFNDAFDLILPAVLSTALALILNQFGPIILGINPPLLPTVMVLMASLLAFLGFIAIRYRVRLIGGLAEWWLKVRGDARAVRERVLIIGGGESGQFLAWMLNTNRNLRVYQVAGFVDDDLYKQGMRIRGVDVMGRREDIPRLVEELDIGIIVFAIHNINAAERREVLRICASTSARTLMAPNLVGALDSLIDYSSFQKGKIVVPVWQNSLVFSDSSTNELLDLEIQPHQLDLWLAELAEKAEAGDISSLQAQITTLRSHLRNRNNRNNPTG